MIGRNTILLNKIYELQTKQYNIQYHEHDKKRYTLLTNKTIDPNSYVDVVITVPEGYTGVALIVRCSYHSAATAGLRLIYLYSQDGVNYDDETNAVDAGNLEDVYFTAGATMQRTVITPVIPDYIKVRFRNRDSSYPITGVNAWAIISR